jgi:heme/copper-type cytochrome/quinol oxidase subunit 3
MDTSVSTATPYVDRWFGRATPGKIGMWVYLVTDAMMFGGFLIAYANLRRLTSWPDPADVLGIQISGAATFILICSSVSMVMAVQSSAQASRRGLLTWLGLTILGGLVFLGIQAMEYTHLLAHGMGFAEFAHGNDLFGSTFYTITGFHGLHVLTGVIFNLVIWIKATTGRYDGDSNHVEIAGLFWHFVDLIWILVFTFVYLL